MVWLPDGKFLTISLAVSTQYRRVTDGQTDEQTDSIVRAMHRHRAVKTCSARHTKQTRLGTGRLWSVYLK